MASKKEQQDESIYNIKNVYEWMKKKEETREIYERNEAANDLHVTSRSVEFTVGDMVARCTVVPHRQSWELGAHGGAGVTSVEGVSSSPHLPNLEDCPRWLSHTKFPSLCYFQSRLMSET